MKDLIFWDFTSRSLQVEKVVTGFPGADFPLAKRITLFGQFVFDVVSFKWKEKETEDAINTALFGTHIFKNNVRNNSPPKVPGSNWQIRAGARFCIL